MHYFIKFFFILSLSLIICSCTKSDRGYTSESILYETESYTINLEQITFDIGENLLLNSDIKTECDEWISDFKTRVSDNSLPGQKLANLKISHKVYRSTPELISTVCEKYAYINGVHGHTWWKARNFDLKNNCFLKLSDLFYDDEYIKILNVQMEEMLTEDSEKYHDLWEIPKIKNGIDDNFYIDKKHLVIFFQPYELSFYAKGVVEFPIEIESLRGYIKEEYLKAH